MPLKGEIERRIKQWMTGAHKCSQRLPLRGDYRLLEHNTLVPIEHGFTDPDQAIAITNGGGNVLDLVSAGFPPACRSSESLERLEEKRFDVVRLQSPRFSSLHLLTNAVNAACVHGITGESVLFQ